LVVSSMKREDINRLRTVVHFMHFFFEERKAYKRYKSQMLLYMSAVMI